MDHIPELIVQYRMVDLYACVCAPHTRWGASQGITRLCVSVCMCLCVFVWVVAFVCAFHLCACVRACTYVCLCLCVCMRACVYVCIHAVSEDRLHCHPIFLVLLIAFIKLIRPEKLIRPHILD